MWRDINGKTGVSGLQGTSGKTYGNLKLFTPQELSDALGDDIEEIPYTPPPAPTPTQLERLRRMQIRGLARSRIEQQVVGTADDPNYESILQTMVTTIEVAELLISKGVATIDDFSNASKQLRDDVQLVRQAVTAMRSAVQAGDSLEDFITVIDGIIPSEE